MSISVFLREKAKKHTKKILFPETEDERILKAVDEIKKQNISAPVLISDKTIEGFKTLNPHEFKDSSINFLVNERKMEEKQALDFLSSKINIGAVLLHLGYADGMVAGANTTTTNTLKPSLYLRKLYPGIVPLTSCFFIQVKLNNEDRIFVFSDCAMNPEPSSAMLAQIANSAAKAMKDIIGIEPYVALLSFSTKGSANSPSVLKVQEAMNIIKKKFPNLKADGELQSDAAIIDWIGKKKAPDSSVAGRANVLIFPDLNSGNIAYKLVERLAQAKAIGPIILGLNPPVNDLSRGCSVDDIIDVCAVTSIQANIIGNNT